MISLDANTRRSGPLFDGEADRRVRRATDDIEHEVADHGAGLVRAKLGTVLKHPTGYYRSHVRDQRTRGRWEVTDGGVIYGPWLEGVGSRNRTTRFKGYATFRRVSQVLDRAAGRIAERVLGRHLRGM